MLRIKTLVSRGSASIRLWTLIRAFALVVFLAVLTTAGVLSQAQSNFTVLHNFSGGVDGAYPDSTPTLDRAGNLYGTAAVGGTGQCSGRGCGTAYRLTHVNGSWTFNPLYSFTGQSDGAFPSGVTIGPDGTLFGTTTVGGAYQYGTLFNLKPPASAVCRSFLCPWTEITLHSFDLFSGWDQRGNVVFDSQGNLYGTTGSGGTHNSGTVYEAIRSGGTWNVNVIHNFDQLADDGNMPDSGVALDSAGNIYGTTQLGGIGPYRFGTVFELSPSQGGWTETILHFFTGVGEGCQPAAGLVLDRAGNLYGATLGSGATCTGYGTLFELSPQGGGWNLRTLYTFSAEGPESTLAIDSAGNLYGTVPLGGHSGCGYYNCGTVFELSPSGGGWTYTDLHDFSGNDGAQPQAGVAVTGPGGYLYGTTSGGGTHGDGVIYQINLAARR